MAKFNRKRYFIDKQFQTKYMILTVLLLLIYTMLFVAILFFPYMVPLTFDYSMKEQTEAARILLTLHKAIWPALGAVIFIMGAMSIFITHRIAGPVYRFKKVLAEVSGGNLDITVKLREKDDLKDFADAMNNVIEELRDFVFTLRDDHETMSSCIHELEDEINSGQLSNETGRDLIMKMQGSKARITETLGKYSQ